MPGAGRVFVDTNVLVYADDRSAGAKTETARRLVAGLVRSGLGVVSTQVLQEYFVVATRKLGVAPDVAQRKVEALARLDVVTIEVLDVVDAIKLHRLRPISFWDALIVRTAAKSGCTRLLSEDLNSGELIDGVRIENPFSAVSS